MTSFDEAHCEEPPSSSEAVPDPPPDPEIMLGELRAEAKQAGYDEGWAEGYARGLEKGCQAGRDEGFQQGHEAGYAHGLNEGRELARQEALQLNALASASAAALTTVEEEMGQSLLTLALDIARQVVRTAVLEHPESVVTAVREVLHINPGGGGPLRLWLHPADLELVRAHLADELKEGHWRILADESISRGGCRAETAYGDVDGTLQTRWRRVAASLGRNSTWEDTP
jgi:flagellar assembly protein FliH